MAAPLFPVLVVCDATAALATEVRANLAPPGIPGETAARSFDSNRCGCEIGPERTVATTNRTVAARNRPRRSRDVDPHCATMASGGDRQADDPPCESMATTCAVVRTRAMRGKIRRMSWSWLSRSGEVQASETITRL